MSSSINGGIVALDDDKAIGDHGYSPLDETSKATQTPRTQPGYFKYEVPSSKKFNIKSLVFSFNPVNWYGTEGTGRLGTAKLKVDGTDKAEFYPQVLGWNVPGGYYTTFQNFSANARPGSLCLAGDGGPSFAQNVVIKLTLALTTSTRLVKCASWIIGKETTGGADVEVLNRKVIANDATENDLASLTVGANGFTLISFGVELWMLDTSEIALLSPVLAGRPIFDTILTHEPTAKNTAFFLVIPLGDGVYIYENGVIESQIAQIHQVGDRHSLMICGEEENMGAAGAAPAPRPQYGMGYD